MTQNVILYTVYPDLVFISRLQHKAFLTPLKASLKDLKKYF